ncbi:hypothetical protein QE382_002562 [Sphingobacterium zeae]|uniref:Uncharacterized protein n=1 Tax=Sphingobacterium zeae TaxID=1776859 RepID=A0ABU0U6J9_9SPHI|nr:hypothetical protein [Sphingobacterium zeae]
MESYKLLLVRDFRFSYLAIVCVNCIVLKMLKLVKYGGQKSFNCIFNAPN